MSNVAPPLPRLLKEVKRGRSHYVKRLENNRRLLQWALEYLQIATDDLEACNVDPQGNIQGADVQIEIRRCRKWLTMARAATSAKAGNPNA